MKASPNITAHYRSSIRTISAVRMMLAYVTFAMYSQEYRVKRRYAQRSPYPVPDYILPI